MFDWMGFVLHPLTHVVFTIGADHVTWAELLGFLTGGACVWLTVRAHVINFPVGIANSALFLLLFTWSRLWADAVLQIIFIALGGIGWWQWLRPRVARRSVVRSASLVEVGLCGAFVACTTAVLTVVLRSANDAAPFWDALTTALSLAAQYLLNTKRLQTWWFWIAADVVYVPLYFAKSLYLTALVYVLFLAMCIAGLRAWRATNTTLPIERAKVVAL